MANLFTTAELNAIKLDVQNIVRDTSINTSIRYRQYTGEDYFDAEDQAYVGPYTNWSGVSALKGTVDETEVSESVSAHDIKYVIMQSGVSDTLLSSGVTNRLGISDVIVESGVTYEVRAIKKDPLEIVYQIFARAV